METILLTGHTGFLASHFADKVMDEGGYRIRYFGGDIRDESDVVRNLRDCDVVVHFAALTYLPPSWDSPEAYFRTNTEGPLNFLRNSSMFKYYVHISTSHVYGNQTKLPIDIDNEPVPNDPYSVSKRAAEQLVRAYSERYGIKSLIIRPFNNFGPRQSKHFVVPTMCLQALKERRISIKSNTRREFIYCKDTARIVHQLLDKRHAGLVQIAKGHAYQIYDMAKMIGQYTKVDMIDVENAPRPNDILCLHGSPNSLYLALPDFKFTPMEEAIQETVDYYRLLLDDFHRDRI